MKFAFAFPYRRITRYQGYRQQETFIEMLRKAEALGFDAVAAGDHLFMPKYHQHVATEVWFDPFSFLAYTAGMTKLRVITDIVVVPYRSPFQTAKSVATLDFMSGGRVIAGMGAGYLEGEFATLRVPFRERGAMTDEYLEIMKVLWTQEQPRYQGKYYSFSDIVFWPKPVQKPHPPLWIGGETLPSMRRAVRHGNGWIPFTVDVEGMKRAMQTFETLWAEAGGRKPGFDIVMRADRVHLTPQAIRSPERQLFWGSAEQITGDIEAFIAAGATYCIANFQGFELGEHVENMERFAEEVMGKFKDQQREAQ